MNRSPIFALALGAALAAGLAAEGARAKTALARYAHIFVIVEENKDYDQILNPAVAPNISALAARYGNATRFYGEVHPSEGNYVALIGGDTFGIHDDDGFSCHAGSAGPFCTGAGAPGYADHTVRADHLGAQLERVGMTWKGYYESLPAPGSLEFTASESAYDDGTRKTRAFTPPSTRAS